jgi:hypothetical protein
MKLWPCVYDALHNPRESYRSFRRPTARFGGTDLSKGARAGLERPFEALAQVVTSVGNGDGYGGRAGFRARPRRAVDQVRRRKRTHPKIDLRRAIVLFCGLQMERAMAEVRSLGVGGPAIWWASVYEMVRDGGLDFEVPRGLQGLERPQRIYAPTLGTCIRNLRKANEHWDVVGPRRHLTRHCRSADRDVGRRDSICTIFSKVGDCGVKHVLQILAELVFTLGECREWKK